jgi:hypothetical protein
MLCHVTYEWGNETEGDGTVVVDPVSAADDKVVATF